MTHSEEVTSWNIVALEQRLKTSLTSDCYDRAWNALQSLTRNNDICWYHYHELKTLIQKPGDSSINDPVAEAILKVLDFNSKEEKLFRLGCEAHIGALLRVLHSNTDLLVTTIFYSLSLDGNERSIKVSSVTKELRKLGFEVLEKLLNQFASGKDYEYLIAWCNYTKHWANVPSMLKCSSKKDVNEMSSWQFQGFSYLNQTYPPIDVISFLNQEYDRQGSLIPKIIRELDLLHEQLCLEHCQESD